MADSRYNNREKLKTNFSYKLDRDTKKRKTMTFFSRMTFKEIQNFEDIEAIDISYNPNDTLMGLSQTYYGDPAYWWVIAWTNNVGSEQDLTAGQTLYILQPLFNVLAAVGV